MRSLWFSFEVIVICLITEYVYGNEDFEPSRRILYGDDANIQEFPYYAAIDGCGAAILSDQWVVTAAHCVPSKIILGKNIVWVGGNSIRTSKSVRYDRIIIHPEGRWEGLQIPANDIALLHLAQPLQFTDKIKPVALPRPGVSQSRGHVFVGRGKTESGLESETLKKIRVDRLSAEECFSYMPKNRQIEIRPVLPYLDKINICAKRANNLPGICNGDSGSPLVQNNMLVGLASYIINEKCPETFLGFYVNVLTYVPWIKSVTGL